jgi:hypothetical protein
MNEVFERLNRELDALERIAAFTLDQQRRILKLYLRVKDQQEDMHGVSDAANDIREFDSRRGYPHADDKPIDPPPPPGCAGSTPAPMTRAGYIYCTKPGGHTGPCSFHEVQPKLRCEHTNGVHLRCILADLHPGPHNFATYAP